MKTISAVLAIVLSLPAIALANADDDAIAIQIAIAKLQQVSIQPGGATEAAKTPAPVKDAPPVDYSSRARVALAAGDAAMEASRRKALGLSPQSRDLGCPCGENCDCKDPCPCPKEKAVTPQPTSTPKASVPVPQDGQLSPYGEWRWSAKNWAWQRVEPKAPVWPQYPTRSVSGRQWRFNGGRITASHLANPSDHHGRERFSRAWLNTQSQTSLCALGSDAHDGNVREQYVVRETARQRPTVTYYRSAPTQYFYGGGCPGGVCPRW